MAKGSKGKMPSMKTVNTKTKTVVQSPGNPKSGDNPYGTRAGNPMANQKGSKSAKQRKY